MRNRKPSRAGSIFGLGCVNKGASDMGVVWGGVHAVVKVVGRAVQQGNLQINMNNE